MNYDNTNTGALFSNKKTADNHPDYKGKVNVNGVEFEIAGWLKKSDKVGTYLSLKISEPFLKEDQPKPTSTGIPF